MCHSHRIRLQSTVWKWVKKFNKNRSFWNWMSVHEGYQFTTTQPVSIIKRPAPIPISYEKRNTDRGKAYFWTAATDELDCFLLNKYNNEHSPYRRNIFFSCGRNINDKCDQFRSENSTASPLASLSVQRVRHGKRLPSVKLLEMSWLLSVALAWAGGQKE